MPKLGSAVRPVVDEPNRFRILERGRQFGHDRAKIGENPKCRLARGQYRRGHGRIAEPRPPRDAQPGQVAVRRRGRREVPRGPAGGQRIARIAPAITLNISAVSATVRVIGVM